MIRMLCRNKVADFGKWKTVFDSHKEAHRQAGLKLESLWRGLEDPNQVFFVFAVADLERAKAFITAPEAARAGRDSGVLEGDYWFVKESGDMSPQLKEKLVS
jgi:hypothetical protein